jgi:2-polyprenyl-6-methoxyphenol hydroxylase-like FAD-dependent oxidoreductase
MPTVGSVAPQEQAPLHAVVVGGSLAGLMTALTLARIGARVTVLERAGSSRPSGAAIRIEPDLLARLTGEPQEGAPDDSAGLPRSWSAVYGMLRDAAQAVPSIELRHDTEVRTVDQGPVAARVTTASGEVVEGDVVIGADGYGSTVRRTVAPEQPDAEYAGYLLWIGIADEQALPAVRRPPGEVAYLQSGDDVLLGYPLPGKDGSLEPGSRQLGWAWFDASRNDLLRAHGNVAGSVVRCTMRPTDVPEATLQELADEAPRRWPAPWSDAVLDCTRARSVTGTPVAEYLPTRLVRGRLALVGDAAHVPTPMTGTGFSESVIDAEAIAARLAAADPGGVAAALQRYEEDRLADARALVEFGQDFSRSFVRGAARA